MEVYSPIEVKANNEVRKVTKFVQNRLLTEEETLKELKKKIDKKQDQVEQLENQIKACDKSFRFLEAKGVKYKI